jgi:pyruvate dehydrogenase E2 component (dihydrolipoamide acetyltransferase)
MAQKIELPTLGEDIESGVVSSILVSSGDTVQEGQGIIEVETDKATIEVPAPFAGRVEEVQVEEGGQVKVGQVIATLSKSNDGEPEDADQPEPDGQSPSGQDEGKVARKGPEPEGDEKGDGPEPDKGASGRDAEEKREAGRKGKSAAETTEEESDDKPAGAPPPASPSVRRLARELGLSIDDLRGSGPGGRILEEDVTAHVRRRLRSQGAAPATGLPDFSRWGPVRREAMSSIRSRIAENLAAAWANVPHVTQADRADVTELEEFRRDWNRKDDRAGAQISLTAILIRVLAAGLRRFPRFNASLDPDAGEMIYKEYVHVGVAVDTEHGLLVPVLRDADGKGILELARELEELSGRARDRKLQPDEMQGASFTITNLGGLGTTQFSPIVPWPQVGILGVGRAEPRARPDGEGLAWRRVLPLSLSYDHRANDGADAARLLRWIAAALEQPVRLVLGS